MIIGITGTYATGKDTAAECLHKMNFEHVSLSEFIREELRALNKPLTRQNQIDMGDELRAKYGADILAKRALERVKDGENYVFTSIRNLQELKLLQQRQDFLLVKMVAPLNVRLQRLKQRNREGDPQTEQQIRESEKKENKAGLTNMQLNKVISMAKVTLNNDSAVEVLQQKLEQLVKDKMYELQPERPDWDHYFMHIAEAVKMRSNCLSAKKGAILVKEKQIISTGYCGSPKKIINCNEGGCKRCTSRHLGKVKSGVYSEPCICAHAEENAIVQAACNGTSTKGTIMYTTFTPCNTCARMIINAGIAEVVAKVKYPDDIGTELLKKAGIKLRVLNGQSYQ